MHPRRGDACHHLMHMTAFLWRVLCIPVCFRRCCKDEGHINFPLKEGAKALLSLRLNESAVEEQLILGKLGNETGWWLQPQERLQKQSQQNLQKAVSFLFNLLRTQIASGGLGSHLRCGFFPVCRPFTGEEGKALLLKSSSMAPVNSKPTESCDVIHWALVIDELCGKGTQVQVKHLRV